MKFQKLIAFFLLFTMLLTQGVFAAETAVPLTQTAPSTWAVWDIQMASIYGLGNEETYSRYETFVTGNHYSAVGESFETFFSVSDATPVKLDTVLTRGEVLQELYDLIYLALKLKESNDITTYFVKNQLMMGRATGDYALDKPCSVQEMLVFAKRTYDHLVYSLNLEAKGLFWKVSDTDNTVYLLGSIHLTDGSVYPLSRDILTAYANAEVLAVEANVLEQNQEGLAYMQQKMMIPGDNTIASFVSPETYAAYTKTMEGFGIPAEFYNKIKPWYASLLLLNLQAASPSSGNQITASMGIDLYFLAQAQGTKPILELESIQAQVDMLDSFSPALQERDLAAALAPAKEGETIADSLQNLFTLWRTGDAGAIEQIIKDSRGTTVLDAEYNTKLWDERDIAFAKSIDELLKKNTVNDYFVVLGAGHMVTDTGIVRTLEQMGYTVNQVK